MASRPLPTVRLLMALAAAAATAGSAAAVTLSEGPARGVPGRSVQPPPTASTPSPWFEMNVTGGTVSFWEPAAMPSGTPAIRAAAGILVDMNTGEILWERSPHLHLAPASLTKVLTSLVALENLSPDREVTITPDALGQASDDTVMGLAAGETLSVRELLEGMLLPSGDDAASAIAVDTVGEARFVAAMNAQVAALGLHDLHFSNTSGLDDPELYTSAYDLAAISTATYDRYPLFDRIVDTRALDLAPTPGHPAFQLPNLDQLLEDYPAAMGIKPGWTGNAGACLIGMAARGGHSLLAVLLDADRPAQLESGLFDWAFQLDGLPPLLSPAPAPSPPAT